MKAVISPVALGSLITLFFSACYRVPDNPAPGNPSPLQDRLQKVDSDLKVGDVGPNVRTLHDYLAIYGYYPNADLTARFPAWRPLIANAPQDPNVFDQQTADAVRQLQVNYGLSSTGVVDAPTRTAMVTARCGVPDGISRLDSSDKFSYAGTGYRSSQSVPVHAQGFGHPANITDAQFTSACMQAASTWGAATSLTFSVSSGGGLAGSSGAGGNGAPPDITIEFGSVDGPGNKLAQTSPTNGKLITLDSAETWSTDTPTPSNAIDLQSVVLHELGHAIGLGHSGIMGFGEVAGAVMFPLLAAGTQDRALAQDDRLAVRPLYDTYVQAPGAANDIGAGTDGSVWVIGTTTVSGGFTIHKWNGTGWDLDSNGASAAVRISVSQDGSPWVANSGGFVYHKSSSSPFSGVWQLVSGISASDIAGIGATAYAVSTTAAPGGFQIYYFDGGQWILDSNGAVGAVRIAVDNSGIPWILQSSGAILVRYEGGWTTLGSGGSGALDIAVPPGPVAAYAWAVNGLPNNQLQMHLFDQQFAYPGPPGLNAPAVTQWWTTPFLSTSGATVSVAAAGQNGQPWIVDGTGKIFRSTIQ